ncbi:hypothetical protein ACTQ45_09045 [Fundicoccus sp. Sow4_D5]|uniref:hypothetical protein n=1 Tax=Fundicoccus sp. Sow4_D5 TaxID=3438782 RepID=UPI003F91282B
MKKGFKLLSSLLVALLMALNVLPSVSAQSTAGEVFSEINAANQTAALESMHANGFVSVAFVSGEQSADIGQFNFDLSYNVDPRFAMEFQGEIVSPFLGSEAYTLSAWASEGIAYLFDGVNNEWTVEDYSSQEYEISDQVYTAINEAQANQTELTADQLALVDKYADLTETDTDYVFTLKQGIDANELWADLESAVDMDALINDAIDQAKTAAAEQGIEFTAEEEEMIRSTYSVETLATILATNPVLSVSYSKDDYKLTAMSMVLTINPNEFVEATEEEAAEAGLPETMIVTMEMTFDSHGQEFDIVVPEEALTAPTETEEVPAEETTEDSVEETTEETTEDSVEETTEDSVEETTEETDAE